mgnify:FL=1
MSRPQLLPRSRKANRGFLEYAATSSGASAGAAPVVQARRGLARVFAGNQRAYFFGGGHRSPSGGSTTGIIFLLVVLVLVVAGVSHLLKVR